MSSYFTLQYSVQVLFLHAGSLVDLLWGSCDPETGHNGAMFHIFPALPDLSNILECSCAIIYFCEI